MFCPRCATQNELEQGYCRQCGQALSSLRLALEGNTDKSLQNLKAGEEWIKAGSVVLIIFTVIALVIAGLGVAAHELAFGYISFINLLLGTLLGVPLIYCGKAKLKRGVRLLSKPQSEASQPVLGSPQQLLPGAGLNTQSPLPDPQSSVTEHTTLDLRKSKQVHRRQG